LVINKLEREGREKQAKAPKTCVPEMEALEQTMVPVVPALPQPALLVMPMMLSPEALPDARAKDSQKGEVGKVEAPVQTRFCKSPEQKNRGRGSTDAEPETHDRAYFALIKKIGELEEENKYLRDQLDRVQMCATQTVDTYMEVAREIEDKYLAEKASKKELQDRLEWMEASSLANRRDLSGGVVGVVGVGQDITERNIERKKRVARELQSFIDTANAPIFGQSRHLLLYGREPL
jgi:hypothetical protein